ncbi:Chaperone protein ClpB [Tritonibacter multivorans]|uniref:Chaperone protein ClpB n=1 Tax=Tritonibacter multivorans TaxID=928856 RepID=A0A0P1GRE6_9RHOB|nr:type VI secretion system ATPase TssH [Tritonibacter multivorans]MDA7422926.1 type VI secretion system ATPase TssH [Tritonibacter multivorans]CUH78111.1 Chaperone protein ClpB [Tritonibacter multivorans]SFD75350.1 type VI secretion system protein VasG [Tritonibacter multivorans]
MAAEIQVETYVGKLNRSGHDAFFNAMRQARGEGHRHVDVLHWLYHVVSMKDSDVSATLRALKLDRAAVLTELTQSLARLEKNVTEMPVISDTLSKAFTNGWVYATLLFGEVQIRTGHILVALLSNSESRRAVAAISATLAQLSAETLAKEARSLWQDSDEENQTPVDGSGLSGGAGEEGPGASTALGRFAKDMTAAAETMDPIVGRDDEIRQIVDVLLRRRQNNPILTGEAGVGKTAVVEGFAQRLAAGDVPPKLRGTKLFELDIQAMQAGASMKGEFEQRLKSVIDEVQASPTPIILFIDEAHTLIGAGGQAGTGDAANLLKPALARGTLRTIAATTWAEYRNYFEKDPALTRRFQPVNVDEPDVERCCTMLRGILGAMEDHHGVRIADEAIVSAVSLSARYIPARQLPDKAVSLLDTACARVAVSQSALPARIADLEQEIRALEAEVAAKEAERELGTTNEARILEAEAEKAALNDELTTLRGTYEAEKGLVDEILALRRAMTGEEVAPGDRDLLVEKMAQLEGANPDERMVYAHVDSQSVASVISDWTGIPVGRMVQDELAAVLTLSDRLQERVIGQDHGLATIAKRIETSRAGLANPDKPIGVFMLCGPSGVGKTETALALAESLYGGEQNIITINMSEFQEAHSVSLLKGAPPGYVGYGEGGRLTEAVRRKPYSVVLLDEIEKAHPDIHELFFQVFDKGIMEDGNGRPINFKNTLILLTSNVGTDVIMEMADEGNTKPDVDELAAALKPFQLDVFPPALLGRIVSIPYFPLGSAALAEITKLKLRSVAKRLQASHEAELVYGQDVLDYITDQCRDPDSGGRMIDNIITNSILPELSRHVLERMVAGEEFDRVEVTRGDQGFNYQISGQK